MRTMWMDLSNNFYENYQKVMFFLLTVQYAIATNDYEFLLSFYDIN